MFVSLGVIFGLILVAAAIHSEIRSALVGIALSNEVEVMVTPAMYREIVQRYQTLDEPDDWERWDQAVLDVLRPERPNEWKYLVRSLGYQVSADGFGARRRHHTVTRTGRNLSPRS
jgi:hypothetical protein